MRLSLQEQETTYIYDPVEKVWIVYSTYKPHINRILERCYDIEVEYTEKGDVFGVRGKANRNQIRIYVDKGSTVLQKASQQTVKTLNKRAEKMGLQGNLTLNELNRILDKFGGKCALTGDDDIQIDHIIPLSIKEVGTEIGNILPMRHDLNASKNADNIFEWYENNGKRFGVTEKTFEEVMAYVAELNGMTLSEYKEYTYSIFSKGKATV